MITGLNNATGTEEIKNIPLEFKLEQNYPNPFNPTTKIRYTIPFVGTHLPAGRQGPSAAVQLKVYNVLGNEVATLVNEEQAPGNYEIEFDAAAGSNKTYMPSGVYFYRFKAGKFSAVNKMILLK